MAITTDLVRRFRFFVENAGYVVGRRAAGAIELARAERWAEQNEFAFVWERDLDADLGDHALWCKDARLDLAHRTRNGDQIPSSSRYRNCDGHEAYSCRMVRPCPDHGVDCQHADTLVSLGGILDPDYRGDYRRVVEAGLALEALADAKRCAEASA